MLKVKQLPTRDIRENLNVSRKKIFEVSILSQRYILLWVSKRYSKIYTNYVKAFKLVQHDNIYVPRSLVNIIPLRVSIVTWCGNNVAENFLNLTKKDQKRTIFKLLDLLRNFNQLKIKKESLDLRYINLLLRKDELAKYNILRSKLTNFFKTLQPTSIGPGIEDPVLSNFTKQKEKVCLVDLDNFSETVNFYYEAGYLLADLEIDYNYPNSRTDKIWRDYSKANNLEVQLDESLFRIGKVSRYANTALNLLNNNNGDYGFEFRDVMRKIEELIL